MATIPLPKEARNALSNRFFVAKSRAKEKNIPFVWDGFSDWWADFEEVCPPDFDYKAWRIVYDLGFAKEYSPRTMRLQRGSKMRLRVTEKSVRMTEAPIEEQDKRVILAAELSVRLLSYTPGTSFQEILRDSLAAAGITPNS
ncbi:MAG: hypothetical protein WAR79_16605 [Melioribacteraceae bacterium]